MKKAIFMLGYEFGYDHGNVEVEVLAEGANGRSAIKMPSGYAEYNADQPWATVLPDGSLVMCVCQDYLRDIQPPVHANLLKVAL